MLKTDLDGVSDVNTNVNLSTSSLKSGSSSSSSSSINANTKYNAGQIVSNISGTVKSVASNDFILTGDDGVEYKCKPASTGVLKYIVVGNHMVVSGTVESTSQMSANLKQVTFSDYGSK